MQVLIFIIVVFGILAIIIFGLYKIVNLKSKIKCPNCGSWIVLGIEKCPHCQAILKTREKNEQNKDE